MYLVNPIVNNALEPFILARRHYQNKRSDILLNFTNVTFFFQTFLSIFQEEAYIPKHPPIPIKHVSFIPYTLPH